MMKRILSLAVGGLALVLASTGTFAAPLSPAGTPEADSSTLVQKVHGCHRDVELGVYGWHYHSRYSCRRIATSPPRTHFRDRPHCREECHWVGRFRSCRVVCR